MAKKKFRWGFYHWSALYALVLLTAALFGLRYLWNYAAAYEMARPYHAIDRYMEELTPEYICGRASDLIDTVDHHIQSQEACHDVIRGAVSGGITYAKKTSECTDEKMVYILRTGNQVIGRVELAPEGEPLLGFTPWAVSADSYDFSYLLTGTVSTTVPAQFPVYVNGAQLNDSYITEAGIRYSYLEDFYEDYDLPTIVSYRAGPCLGEITLSVTDPEGNPVTIDENTDLNVYLDNCTAEEAAQLDAFMEEFIQRYVRFSNSSSSVSRYNYRELLQNILEDSPLAKRCKEALVGMVYGVSQTYQIKSIGINRCTNIGNDRYLCDVTYVVDIRDRGEMIENVFNMKIIIVRSEGTLKAETLRNY